MNYNSKKIGNGPDLLLVHGWGGTLKSLEKLGEFLSNKYTVSILELPGHGQSESMPEPWGTEQFVNFVKDHIEKNNLKDIVYVGHSFGGHIGLRLGIENYDKISKLVLINSSGLKPKNSFKRKVWKIVSVITKPFIAVLLFPIRKQFKMFLYKYVIRETDYAKTSGTIRETLKKVLTEFVDGKISAIIKPTFVIWGDKDTYTPLWMGIRMHNEIKNSKMEVMEGTHSLPLKFPQEVAAKILTWTNNE